jgi:tetratricopeptide (TPR) repeat protein
MAKVGRNQPCPCGSGKKYKLCCLPADEAAEVAARGEPRRPPPLFGALPGRGPTVDDGYERFEHMSNDAVDLIHAGKLEEAERLCQRLLDEFPDLPDGHIRLGQLFRARGEPTKAASHLRLAATVARAADDDPALPLSLEREADELDPPAP